MTKLTDYAVVREHTGDKWYEPGDTRTANATEVAHLVPHVLEPIGDAEAPKAKEEPADEKAEPEPANKAEPAPANKAEPAAPANKATSARKGKSSAQGASASNKGE